MVYTRAEILVLPIAFLVMVGVSALLRIVLIEKPQRLQDLPFLVIAVAVLLLESIKQTRNILRGYDTWSIPLHYCSTFAFWFPLAEFSRGKMRKRMQNVAFCFSFCLLLCFYFGPRCIMGGACENIFGSFNSFHTFFYHHLALFYCILGIVFKRFQPSKTDGWLWIICTSVYFSLAVIFGFIFRTNYFNVLYSDIPFMEKFRLQCGQTVYLLFFSALLLWGGASVFWLSARQKKNTSRNHV